MLIVSSVNGGTVSLEPAGGLYAEAAEVTLTAHPRKGYKFLGWDGLKGYSSDNLTDRSVSIKMPACSIEVSPIFSPADCEWNFMIYMAGDQNGSSSLSPFVLKDINEMEAGLYDAVDSGNTDIEKTVRVIVLADRRGASNTYMYLVKPDDTNSVVVSPKTVPPFISGGELNMADPQSLENFLSYCMDNFPANHNALVLWNHGGGVRSLEQPDPGTISKFVCVDGDDILRTNEVQTAVADALGINAQNGSGGDALDLFGYDACIMGEVESAYETRHLTDYFIASPASEWGSGWDYQSIFKVFTSESSPPDAPSMADTLVSQYHESTINDSIYQANTMTAVKTDQLEALKTAIDAMAEAIHDFEVGSASEDEFIVQRDNSVFYYEPRPLGQSFNDAADDAYEYQILTAPYYDLFDLCSNIEQSTVYPATVKTQAQAVLDALDDAVVACYGNSEGVDDYYSGVREPLNLDFFETDDDQANRGLSILIPHGELHWTSSGTTVTHYAFDLWYTAQVLNMYEPAEGGIDFCTGDSDADADGNVESWRELFEAWYDPDNLYTPGSF